MCEVSEVLGGLNISILSLSFWSHIVLYVSRCILSLFCVLGIVLDPEDKDTVPSSGVLVNG